MSTRILILVTVSITMVAGKPPLQSNYGPINYLSHEKNYRYSSHGKNHHHYATHHPYETNEFDYGSDSEYPRYYDHHHYRKNHHNHRSHNHHHHHHSHRMDEAQSGQKDWHRDHMDEVREQKHVWTLPSSQNRYRDHKNNEGDDIDYDDVNYGYLMEDQTTELKSSKGAKNSNIREDNSEESTLKNAFHQHMNSSQDSHHTHDVYAYKLPSDLWFIVKYVRDKDGHVNKYMNIVKSFTSYLDTMDDAAKTISVNDGGVETVFRLESKH